MTSGVPHIPTEETRQLVSELAAFGNSQREIGLVLGISDETVAKHYRHELDTSSIKAVHTVAKSLFKKAVEDNDLGAQIFYLKTRSGGKFTEKKEEDKKDTLIDLLIAEKLKNNNKTE